MFAKYSSEKFPLVFIYEVLTLRKNVQNDADFKDSSPIKIKAISRTNFNLFPSGSRRNYYFLFEKIKNRYKEENLYYFKNFEYKKEINSIQQALGLSNDMIV